MLPEIRAHSDHQQGGGHAAKDAAQIHTRLAPSTVEAPRSALVAHAPIADEHGMKRH